MSSMLGKTFSRCHFEIFSMKTGSNISCRLSETICMKSQSHFLKKKKKKSKKHVLILSSELAQRAIKVKGMQLLSWAQIFSYKSSAIE